MANKERDYVAAMYPGRGWKQKVARMPQEQVVAIFLRAQGTPPKPEAQTKESDDGSDHPSLF